MLSVHVTVAVGSRAVSVEDLADARLASTLRGAGQDIARRLATIQCPVHAKTAHNVRVHFDARGNADLQYESCCERLGKRIGETLC
ncbi:MAG TPA: hypothetical protein VN894_12070 [Polyangiaceae bacterium]|nr:hypothetical protein [Polyangiaceae bacterium]